MGLNVGKELAALRRMSVDDLRTRYAEVFGETTNGRRPPSAPSAGRSPRLPYNLQ